MYLEVLKQERTFGIRRYSLWVGQTPGAQPTRSPEATEGHAARFPGAVGTRTGTAVSPGVRQQRQHGTSGTHVVWPAVTAAEWACGAPRVPKTWAGEECRVSVSLGAFRGVRAWTPCVPAQMLLPWAGAPNVRALALRPGPGLHSCCRTYSTHASHTRGLQRIFCLGHFSQHSFSRLSGDQQPS